jgi:RNA polymerase sigma-70 factor (ECF subfamily)
MLWEQKKKLENLRYLEGYLHRMIINKVIDLLRRKRNSRALTYKMAYHFDFTDNSLIEDSERVHAMTMLTLKNAIDKLPVIQRKLIEKVYLEGESLSEVAKLLNLKISTAYNYRSIAFSKLREYMKPISD